MSPAPPLEGLVDWLTRWPDDLFGKLRHAGEVLNWVLGGLPARIARFMDDLERRAKELWRQICAVAEEVGKWFTDTLFPGIMAPITLFSTSRSWTDDVFSKVTDVQGRYDDKQMTADEHWHGRAQRAYAQVVTSQRNAANAVSETVRTTREVLQTLSIAMGAAYVSLAALLLLAAVEVEGGTATLFGVVTIPVGLAVILKGVLVAVAGIGGFVAVMQIATDGTLTAFGDLKEALNDNRGLEGGAWPSPAPGLADGSMTDADQRSGWTYYDDPTN